jgi:hypothetical protein
MKGQRECRRLHDWDLRLQQYLREVLARPFAPGEHDCCLHVCNAVLAMTGADLALGFRGKYRNKVEAARLLKKRGGVEGVAESVAWHFRLEEIGLLFAGRGDIVLLEMPERGPVWRSWILTACMRSAPGPKASNASRCAPRAAPGGCP